MVSLVTARSTILFGGAIAAGIAAFAIAYGRDEGTPMMLPVLPHVPTPAPAPIAAIASTPAPPVSIEPAPAPVLAPAKPDLAVMAKITALAQAARKRVEKAPVQIVSTCDAVASGEQKRITKLVRAWIDAQHPDERLAITDRDGMESLIGIGCAEPDGVLVSAAMDRRSTKAGRAEVRRNYVVRVSGESVELVAERNSTPSIDWMEWADEGGLGEVGTLDFDGDGRRDTIYLDLEHEGGATHSHATVMLRSAGGAVSQIATITDAPGAFLVNGKLVVGAVDEEQHHTYWRCIDKDRQITSCPEAVASQRISDTYDALARLDDTSTWNRDQLASDFATLGIKGHDDLVAAMPERSPDDRLRRHVEQFLIATNQYDPADARIERTHVEAARYFGQLASQLGDQACTVPALADDVRETVTAWVARQAHQDLPLAIQPDCGNYVWTTYFKGEAQIEVLLTVAGSTVTKVVSFPGEVFEGPGTQGFVHQGGFFAHGTALVGLVITDTKIYAIANGKVVGTRTGQPHVVDYDARWALADRSFDLASDGAVVLHATASGLEKIDPEPLRSHQLHRAALERVLDIYTPLDKPYVAALRTLGAPDVLVAEAKARTAGSAP
ncbi:MAG TPA: hypothetical protein VFQ65_23645 [Kofleriaceae bacterium]|nr:hypothetical protein [Kofleriaceae bacterium]